ncbi:hypothetical protein A2U01_0067571 [Trifolium medium]|uniref:Uncharacterized protein n=1 Tax=Trifolium medium TaxID=97028 RepID=A0A392SBQ1_9FABA|nr:hypothetical protein [Trifolium medium]
MTFPAETCAMRIPARALRRKQTANIKTAAEAAPCAPWPAPCALGSKKCRFFNFLANKPPP